jgi:hypothetical protein
MDRFSPSVWSCDSSVGGHIKDYRAVLLPWIGATHRSSGSTGSSPRTAGWRDIDPYVSTSTPVHRRCRVGWAASVTTAGCATCWTTHQGASERRVDLGLPISAGASPSPVRREPPACLLDDHHSMDIDRSDRRKPTLLVPHSFDNQSQLKSGGPVRDSRTLFPEHMAHAQIGTNIPRPCVRRL